MNENLEMGPGVDEKFEKRDLERTKVRKMEPMKCRPHHSLGDDLLGGSHTVITKFFVTIWPSALRLAMKLP